MNTFARLAARLTALFDFRSDKEPAAVREQARARTKWVQRGFIAAGALYLFLAFSANSTYSFSEKLVASTHLNVDFLPTVLTGLGLNPEPKTIFKTAFLALFWLFFWSLIVLNEPLSDIALLSGASGKSGDFEWTVLHKTLLKPLSRDIECYAKILPSLKFPAYCNSCAHSAKCQNYMPSGSRKQILSLPQVWDDVILRVNNPRLSELLSATLKCRFVHYCRIILIHGVYITLGFYFLHRFIESKLFGFPPEWWSIGLAYPAGGALALAIISLPNRSDNINTSHSGVWGRYDAVASKLSNDPDVQEAHLDEYKRIVCSAKGCDFRYEPPDLLVDNQLNLYDARVARLLLDHMDSMVTKKLARLLNIELIQAPRKKRAHVLAITREMELCARHLFEVNEQIVVETYETIEQVLTSLRVPATLKGLENDVVTKLELNQFCALSRGDDSEFTRLVTQLGYSFVIATITFAPVHVEEIFASCTNPNAITIAERSCKPKGFVVLRSTDLNLFREYHLHTVKTMIEPFIHRLAFEIVRNELSTKENTNATTKPA